GQARQRQPIRTDPGASPVAVVAGTSGQPRHAGASPSAPTSQRPYIAAASPNARPSAQGESLLDPKRPAGRQEGERSEPEARSASGTQTERSLARTRHERSDARRPLAR